VSTPAYRYIETKLRIAELTLLQWVAVMVGLLLALAWWQVSPLGAAPTLFIAVYIVGFPVMCAFVATQGDIDVWVYFRSALAWRRGRARYLPGAGADTQGYVIASVATARERADAGMAMPELDVVTLWE
jgi:hypothetical protein